MHRGQEKKNVSEDGGQEMKSLGLEYFIEIVDSYDTIVVINFE